MKESCSICIILTQKAKYYLAQKLMLIKCLHYLLENALDMKER